MCLLCFLYDSVCVWGRGREKEEDRKREDTREA